MDDTTRTTVNDDGEERESVCARHEPRIPFGGDDLSRDNVTTDDNN